MHSAKLLLIFLSLFYTAHHAHGQMSDSSNRWTIRADTSLSWRIDNRLPHQDHIEMSGEKISAILQYRVNNDGSLFL